MSREQEYTFVVDITKRYLATISGESREDPERYRGWAKRR